MPRPKARKLRQRKCKQCLQPYDPKTKTQKFCSRECQKAAPTNAGRPKIVNDETVAKLEEAFKIGCNETEAALHANISVATLIRYKKAHPDFAKRIELLKKKPILKARLNVINALNDGDMDTSKWYLERKAKDEFSARTENHNKHEVPNLSKIEVVITEDFIKNEKEENN